MIGLNCDINPATAQCNSNVVQANLAVPCAQYGDGSNLPAGFTYVDIPANCKTGFIGSECQFADNQGTCPEFSRNWIPDSTGDCNICDSTYWNWIPGGWQAVVNSTDPLNQIAQIAYIPKNQTVPGPTTYNAIPYGSSELKQNGKTEYFGADKLYKDDPSCYQPNTPDTQVPYCGLQGSSVNTCDNLCKECSVMSWDTSISAGPTVVDASETSDNTNSLLATSGQITSNTCGQTIWGPSPTVWSPVVEIDLESSSEQAARDAASATGLNMNPPPSQSARPICERNPVLTLRGTSDSENQSLVNDWLSGKMSTSKYGGTQDIQDPTASPTELQNRIIKAMRCCLGLAPGFQSVDGNGGSPKTGPGTDSLTPNVPGSERWLQEDCPPGVVCPSSQTCKQLFQTVMNGDNPNLQMDLNDFGSMYFPKSYSLDGTDGTKPISNVTDMLNPAYYAKAYCELMSGGANKNASGQLDSPLGFDDEINTMCRKAMYKYCSSPVEVSLITDGNYWSNPLASTTSTNTNTSNYFMSSYSLPLNIFSESCYNWFSQELTNVLPSDYGTRDMLLGSACQRLQVDGWYNPANPAGSPLLTSFVNSTGQITDVNGRVLDLTHSHGPPPYSGVGTFSATDTTSPTSGIPALLQQTCSCFLLGSTCTGNCSYQYCSMGTNN